MDTQIITNPSDQELDMLARALRNGEIVSIPTETVYGLGANGLDPEAMDKIYTAKGRPSDNPLILHVPNSESIFSFASTAIDCTAVSSPAREPTVWLTRNHLNVGLGSSLNSNSLIIPP